MPMRACVSILPSPIDKPATWPDCWDAFHRLVSVSKVSKAAARDSVRSYVRAAGELGGKELMKCVATKAHRTRERRLTRLRSVLHYLRPRLRRERVGYRPPGFCSSVCRSLSATRRPIRKFAANQPVTIGLHRDMGHLHGQDQATLPDQGPVGCHSRTGSSSARARRCWTHLARVPGAASSPRATGRRLATNKHTGCLPAARRREKKTRKVSSRWNRCLRSAAGVCSTLRHSSGKFKVGKFKVQSWELQSSKSASSKFKVGWNNFELYLD